MIVRAALDDAVARELVEPQRRPPRPQPAPTDPPQAAAAIVDRPGAQPVPRQPRGRSASTRRCTSLPTPACDAVRSSDSSGPTSTRHVHDCRSRARCRTSAADPSSSASRPAPADAPSNSTTTHCDVLVRWRRRLQRDRLPHGADDWMFCNTQRPLPQPGIDHATVRSHRATQRASAHPLPRPAPHPRVAARRRRRRHQGGVEQLGIPTPRSRCTPTNTCCQA